MLGTTEENTHFTRLKAGGKFAIYALGVYLGATFTVSCLGLIIGSPLLTFPLAMLISNPVVWVLMGIVLTVAYKMVVEPLFHLAKDYISKKRAPEEEKSKEKPKLQRGKSLDSGLGSIPGSPGNDRKRRNSCSPSIDSGVSVGSTESKQTKKTQVKTYSTAGDGNCFFHAVFGDNSSGPYKTEKAQDMRKEWHKFLSQFTSLDDVSMPALLKTQLEKVFNIFLNTPGDLTGRSDKIKGLAECTNKKIKKVERKVKKLIRKLLSMGLPKNKVDSDLKWLAVSNFFSARRYDKNYNSESAVNSFLNSKSVYKFYLEAISSQNYYIFIEEIPILASLANIEIGVHYKNNNKDMHTPFKPYPQMINEGYQRNDELWDNKEHETIYFGGNHYSRAKIVEVEPSFLEKVSSFMQGIVMVACNSIKNASSKSS